ncbi:hypothetical protein J437_LFUL012108 [Ladona fulva]|uniref:Uncharacterized protein n=1 Tax=Ladona fulva TaxID=123851 RepID=A0A8K0P470_LADFU|nr:hypothetical protein J437_LFUL012108 [Ladona fulva]
MRASIEPSGGGGEKDCRKQDGCFILHGQDEAAVRIQSTFRGYRVRRDAVEGKGGEGERRGRELRREDAVVVSSEERTSGEFHDHVVLEPLVLETGKMREDCGAPAAVVAEGERDRVMDNAAARIQAGFRGYRVRKRMREEHSNGTQTEPKPSQRSDEEEGKAATKIQAGVRGFLTRRRLKRRRDESGTKQAEQAAIKIQAGFRGYKGRQKAKARRQMQTQPSK